MKFTGVVLLVALLILSGCSRDDGEKAGRSSAAPTVESESEQLGPLTESEWSAELEALGVPFSPPGLETLVEVACVNPAVPSMADQLGSHATGMYNGYPLEMYVVTARYVCSEVDVVRVQQAMELVSQAVG